MITEKTIKFIEMLNTPGKKATKFKVKDNLGERTLIIPKEAPTFTFSGDLGGEILWIEALTGTRLRDGEDPAWFWRLYHQFKEQRDPGVSFAEIVKRQHSDKIDVLSSELDERAYKNWLAEVGVEGIKGEKADAWLNVAERNVIEALSTNKLIGEKLAKKAGYPYNSNFKSTLSSLRKRGILGNKSPGYFVKPAYHFLLVKSDQSQD